MGKWVILLLLSLPAFPEGANKDETSPLNDCNHPPKRDGGEEAELLLYHMITELISSIPEET